MAIVGGGIAGLYVAFKLAETERFEVTVFEAGPRFGGRIETVRMGPFEAEFGPMRFEPAVQPLLAGLLKNLGLRTDPFPSMASDPAAALTASDRYNLGYDELRHTTDQAGTVPLSRPLDLLRLGVIRLFRSSLCQYLKEDPDTYDLCADTTAAPPAGYWDATPGSDNRVWRTEQPWNVEPWAPDREPAGSAGTSGIDFRAIRLAIQGWLDHFDEDGYEELRHTAKHRTWQGKEGHYLRDEGFWNAMSEELSQPALRYLRDEGTFYHLFIDNPNAVEWGIFWLRLFRTEANHLFGIQGGSQALVRALCQKLHEAPNVRLRAAQEVLEVAQAPDPKAVRLKVRDHRGGADYSVEADHCVLALPLTPLQRLAAAFPEVIREDLHRVFGFPLLKCFLLVKNPWWRAGMPPHTGVAGVATRELHFWRKTADRVKYGLVMLYTDRPASEFWKPYVELPVHDRAELGPETEGLKLALVRQLLLQARRRAHLRLRELLLDKMANGHTKADVDEICNQVDEFCNQVESRLADASRQHKDRIRRWYQSLIGPAPRLLTMEHLERILDVLRHPGHPKRDLWKTCDSVRGEIQQFLIGRDGTDAPSAQRFAEIAVRIVFPSGKDTEGPQMIIEEQIKQEAVTVEAWGIRDWSREPVGAGCHAWMPGARSWEVMSRIQAFGLAGRPSHREFRNVHICGEALSDYQGFIEGALRSAERVVSSIKCSSE
jgi:monoamine oxidase